MTTIPKDIFDLSVRHQVALQRYGNGVVRDVIALLNASERELMEKIRLRGEKGPWTTARLKALFAELQEMNDEAHWGAEKALVKEMHRFADHEAEVAAAAVQTKVPENFTITRPSNAQLAAVVDKTPITVGPDKKLLLEEIFSGLAAGKEEAIRGAVRLGIVEGETVDAIVRRLIGTRANRYTDGVLEKNRRGTAAIVRTIINHVSNSAAQATYAENGDLVKGWTFTSTLDGRTTVTCASLSGTEWPIGQGPQPPRHVNCRSFATPRVATWRELGIDLDEMPPSVRASKNGPVRADISFDEWLSDQPVAVQKEVLGATRQKLFAEGMKMEKFTDNKGVVYSLTQLEHRNREMFDQVFGPSYR